MHLSFLKQVEKQKQFYCSNNNCKILFTIVREYRLGNMFDIFIKIGN